MGTREALVGISDEAWAAAAAKRCKGLVHLLGIEEREAGAFDGSSSAPRRACLEPIRF